MSTDTKSVERLALKFMSQVGDDVQEFYSHEALFKVGAETLRALAAERDAATARVAELEAERDRLWEALEPFSKESEWWFTRNYNASDAPVEGFGDYEGVMTCGDLFNARAALSASSAKKESRDG